jgi:hypothetical protein
MKKKKKKMMMMMMMIIIIIICNVFKNSSNKINYMSQYCSVGIELGYRLGDRSSIPGRG